MRGKIRIKKLGWRQKIKVRYLVLAVVVAGATMMPHLLVKAESCPDVRVVFARGSGGERWTDQNYLAFKGSIEAKLQTTDFAYEFIDLDYPAVGIGDLGVLAGAYFGAGDAYEFGESVKSGVKKLDKMINSESCPGTKYVIGGYSQGAMVVSGALGSLRSDRLIYAATFGDPKLYLPEGKGAIPAACKGENLSDYRMYVPDCQAYKGMLGAYIPYRPNTLAGKVGTWCNKRDIFCSSHFNISDHVSYVRDNLYEDASRVIFDKICRQFGVKNQISSPHDTAILIDSTGSMSGLIAQYKAEALKLATKTLASDGRVALYDYRDYQEGYRARQRCSFETCTLETFTMGLETIEIDGGGDTPESLLASSLQVMQELNWKRGATKSVVVLTDAGYHEPDFDGGGTTKLDVVRLSKQIDPVNFYVITTPENVDDYADLANETGGRVATTVDDLSELTEYIMARYDSLPRVEETDIAAELPTLTVLKVEQESDEVTIRFATTGSRVIVALNDAILGVTKSENGVVKISGLNDATGNKVVLIPLGDDVRGEAVEVAVVVEKFGEADSDGAGNIAIKAPNTGEQ